MFDLFNGFSKPVKTIKVDYVKKTDISKDNSENVYKLLELIASVLSIVGTVMLAIFGYSAVVRLIVFCFYLVASAMFVIFSYHKKLKWIMISQLVFCVSAMIGIASNIFQII